MRISDWSSDVCSSDLNDIEKAEPSATRAEACATLILLVAPMMPHLAEEAWAGLPDARRTTDLVADAAWPAVNPALLADDEVTIVRSEEHTSELQSLMRSSYAVFCLKKKHTKLT